MPKLNYAITVAIVEWMNADNEDDASNWLVYLIPRGNDMEKRYWFISSVLYTSDVKVRFSKAKQK